MKVYVCPICDHAMEGRYYCRNCHEFVRNPYYMEINYSLDRAAVKSEGETEIELNNKKNTLSYFMVISYLYFISDWDCSIF